MPVASSETSTDSPVVVTSTDGGATEATRQTSASESETDEPESGEPESTESNTAAAPSDDKANEDAVSNRENKTENQAGLNMENKVASESNETQSPKQKTELVKKYNPLDDYAASVILYKGTEPRSLDGYTMTKDPGTYICRQCNA
ncbi:MAG: hypothetical protein KDB00_00905, partial [Planctomycetales bacterium]|nr:hypothetical protein [Planctomycetales bacterium]